MLGEHATSDSIAAFRERMGLDEPVFVQYRRYMRDLLRFDLGRSIMTNRPVTEEIRAALSRHHRADARGHGSLPRSLAWLLASSPPIGTTLSLTWASCSLRLLGVSMPIFWLGLMLVYIFGFKLQWLPPSGRLTVGIELKTLADAWGLTDWAATRRVGSNFLEFFSGFNVLSSILTANWAALWSSIKHLILPSVALGSIPMAIIARMTRSSLLDTLGEDYIRTARAKGLQERMVLWRHALRNALLPIVTIMGLQLGFLLGGAILTETIFSWPGLGRLVVNRILARDYPAVQGSVIFIAFVFVLVNLIVDVSYGYLDPRIHYE